MVRAGFAHGARRVHAGCAQGALGAHRVHAGCVRGPRRVRSGLVRVCLGVGVHLCERTCAWLRCVFVYVIVWFMCASVYGVCVVLLCVCRGVWEHICGDMWAHRYLFSWVRGCM